MTSKKIQPACLKTGQTPFKPFSFNPLVRAVLGAVLVTAGPSGIALANGIDGYGVAVVTDSTTGNSYRCDPSDSFPPSGNPNLDGGFCPQNPFVAWDAAAQPNPTYNFVKPDGVSIPGPISIAYAADTTGNQTFQVNASQLGVLEGNNIAGFTLTSDGVDAYGAFYRNYSGTVMMTSQNGGSAYLTENFNEAATLTSTGIDSYFLIQRNSTAGAIITNSGGATMVIDGNGAEGATMTNQDAGSTITLLHNDAANVRLDVQGGVMSAYGNALDGATITVAQGAALVFGDCSVALGCLDINGTATRGTSIAGSTDSPSTFNSSGDLTLSGNLNLTNTTIANAASGTIYLDGVNIDEGVLSNEGNIILRAGVNTLSGDIRGTDEGTVQINTGATLFLTDGGINTENTLIAAGGTLQVTVNLDTATVSPISFGRSELSAIGGSPITLALNVLPRTGASALAPLDLLVVDIEEGPDFSVANAFQMTPFTSGGIAYSLVRKTTDGDWYLQAQSAPTAATPVPTMGHFSVMLLTLLAGLFGVKQLRRKGATQ